MPRSRFLAKLRDVLTSLLLAVAVSFAWPAMGAPHDQHARPGAHHLAATDGHHHADRDATPVCSAEIGCCVMTHCHPGVAQLLSRMPPAGLHPKHLPSPASTQAGIDPAILVPPPRLLLGRN